MHISVYILTVTSNMILLIAPSQQPPPEHEPINSTTLHLYWGRPDYPNGVIIRYHLYRDGGKIATVAVDGKFSL